MIDSSGALAILAAIANPFELTTSQWFIGWLGRFAAVSIFDLALERFTKTIWPLMPSRLAGMSSGHKINSIDRVCLLTNTLIELVFLYQIAHLVAVDPKGLLGRGIESLRLTNTIFGAFCLFILDDLLYNLAHRFLHWRPIYPYIHKIHHRQFLPERGYWDAAIEHPVEQIIGLGVFWVSMRTVVATTGLHLVGFIFATAFYSFFNIVNHMPYDTQFRFLGFEYSTRAHEMHHRIPQCNFSKSCMHWDWMLGTFREYAIPKSKEQILKQQ